MRSSERCQIVQIAASRVRMWDMCIQLTKRFAQVADRIG